MRKRLNKIHILYLLFVVIIGILFRSCIEKQVLITSKTTYRMSSLKPIRVEDFLKEGIADRKPIKVIDTLNILETFKEV